MEGKESVINGSTDPIQSPNPSTTSPSIPKSTSPSTSSPSPSSATERPPLFPGAGRGAPRRSLVGMDLDPALQRVNGLDSGLGGASLLKAAARRRSGMLAKSGEDLSGAMGKLKNATAASSPAGTSNAADRDTSDSLTVGNSNESDESSRTPSPPGALSDDLVPLTMDPAEAADGSEPPAVYRIPLRGGDADDESERARSPSPTSKNGLYARRASAGSISSRRVGGVPPTIVIREPSQGSILDVAAQGKASKADAVTTTTTTTTTAGTPVSGDEEDDGAIAFAARGTITAKPDEEADPTLSTEDEMDLSCDELGIPLSEAGDDDGFVEEANDERRRRRRKKRKEGDVDEEGKKKRKKKKKKRNGDEEEGLQKKKKKKFSLAPRNWVDRILFLWGFRLLNRIRRQEDIHDVPLHLKSTESAKSTGDALEKTWNEEVERCKRSSATVQRVGTGLSTSTLARDDLPQRAADIAMKSKGGYPQHPHSLENVVGNGGLGGAGSDKTFIGLPGDDGVEDLIPEVGNGDIEEGGSRSSRKSKASQKKGRKNEDVEVGVGAEDEERKPGQGGAGDSSRAGAKPGKKDTIFSKLFSKKKAPADNTPKLHRALNRAFGVKFSLLAIWKALWALFTWLGAYGILKWTIEYCDARAFAFQPPPGSEPLPSAGIFDLFASAVMMVRAAPPNPPGNEPVLGPAPALIKPTPGSAPPLYQGHLLALALFLSTTFSSLCFHQLSIQCTRIGVQCRAALMVLIYRKSLRLSYVKGGVGDIVNLIANECNRVAEASVTWHYMWSAIAECAIIIALAIYDIGVAALPASFLIMFVLLPLQYYLAIRASDISLRSTELITKRVHLMSEILTAIKLIKFYAWEAYFVTRISQQRGKEMAELRTSMMLRAANCMVVFIAPVVATLGCLVVALYTLPGGVTTAEVFTLLSLFNTLRYPLLLLPNAVRTFQGAKRSLQHLEDFFNLPEVDTPLTTSPPVDDPALLMEITNASFVWDGELDHPSIMDLSLEIHRGQLIAVVGDLSSGKSLLAAILGQVKRMSGSMASYGTCGYSPQEPWLINATIRDNIVFGLEYDEQLYLDVIRLCGLTRDLMLLSNGDESVVSDLNLSTSQRQRLSLARCLYHNPDIVLIEDCLSDFDLAHAKRLFKECVRNNLLKKGKAVVLVTQQKQFLPECDLILVLKGEKVIERGTFAELKARKVNFSAWVSDYIPIEDDPAGVLDGVNEIRLDGANAPTATIGGASSPMSPVSSPISRFVAPAKAMPPGSPALSRSPFAQGRLVHQHKPSPLATADVITQDPMELQSIGPEADPTQMTIRALMALNQQSIQNAQINEHTISKMIERNQLSILTGNPSRPPANFPNQDPVTRTIDANQLTVHSVNGFDPAMAGGDKGIITRTSFSPIMAYDMYLREGYGRIVGWSIVILFFLVHGIRFFSDYWLQLLVDDRQIKSREYHIGAYGILTAAIAVGVFARGALFSNSVLRKSTTLHDRCLHRILRAPMSFYDVTPLGQVLSNFARHLFLVDEALPDATLQVLSFAPIPLGTLALVAAIIPWFWITLPLYFGLAYLLIWKCAHVEKKLRTLEASNKSPMFAHLSTTLEGLFSIRLYHAQERFDAFNRILIDADHKALYSLMLIKILQALYLDLISCFAIYMTAVLVIASPRVSGSTAGLAISNALQLLLFVQWMVRMGADVHLCMTSVAAVTSFTDHVPVESSDAITISEPPPDWPTHGAIEFKHVTLRYHRYGIAVLKAVSFRFNPGEKIGIVGRSGSGKTTLLVALMRIVDNIEGEIYVDGIDITTLSLSALRSRIAVIPQEPVLLTGTIRSNLDPFGVRTDEEVWKAVRDVHLGAKIEEMPLKLNTPISENGRAFSLAERQLFCVARAILMKTKIVVFDEPTTAADNDTDALIQSTIHENFEDATVIVLASRFRMIAQADRIIVMDGGKIVESDSPLALLDNPRSKLSLMVSQTGDIDLAKLRQLALNRAETKAMQKPAQPQLQQQQQMIRKASSTASASIFGLNQMNAGAAGSGSTNSNPSPTLPPQVNLALAAASAYDSHSSISTLSSTESAAAGDASNPALNTTSSANSFLNVVSNSSATRKAGSIMPKSLEGIFGESAQLERQQKAVAVSLSTPPISPLSPTSLNPIPSATQISNMVSADSTKVAGNPSSSSSVSSNSQT
ncbi:hypothetical protein HDU97_010239 [Phlyctochytrium planicorne]|nr:hypothetical protein HDU97_010239 [Phlyctochytrium planicorne]